MPSLNSESISTQVPVFESMHVVFAGDDRHRWAVARIVEGGRESVGIRLRDERRLRRSALLDRAGWFLLPADLAEPVLARARELEVARHAAMVQRYEERSEDVEAEAEAHVWCEALIGDSFEEG